jgi:hypothetical protein
MHSAACVRSLSLRCRISLILPLLVASSAAAYAQGFSRFLELENPGRLSLRLFAVGYGAEKYGTTHAGFEIDQTVTGAVSVIGRAIAYQVYQGSGFDSPLTPGRHSAPRNFGLLEGGASFSPIQGTTFTLLGGDDVGDSDAPVFENDFTSWLWLQSRHPISLSYSTSHYFQNGVTNGLLDARMVAFSTGRLLLLLGVGGAIWGGGSVGQAKGQGGPDVGFFLREWRLGVDLQTGYGSSRVYGLVSFARSFSWDE